MKRSKKDKPFYPELVDLFNRLKEEGRDADASICAKYLIYLNLKDNKIDRMRKELAFIVKNNLIS